MMCVPPIDIFFPLSLHDLPNLLIGFSGAIVIQEINYRGVSGLGKYVRPFCRRVTFNF